MIKLKVTSIAPSLNKLKLEQMFEEFGKVSSIKVFRTIDRSAVAMAHVEMMRDREAEEAVKELNGVTVDGIALVVEYSQEIVRKTGNQPAAPLEEEDDEFEDSFEFEDEDDSEPREVPLDELEEEI